MIVFQNVSGKDQQMFIETGLSVDPRAAQLERAVKLFQSRRRTDMLKPVKNQIAYCTELKSVNYESFLDKGLSHTVQN